MILFCERYHRYEILRVTPISGGVSGVEKSVQFSTEIDVYLVGNGNHEIGQWYGSLIGSHM